MNTVFLHREDTSIEREVCVKIRKFRLITTIVLSLFFFFSLDFYALYVYARLKKKKYGASTLAALYLPPSAIPGENESEYSLFT